MIQPVYVDRKPQLYDIFLPNGTWLGSKRKFEWAYEYLMWYLNKSSIS